MILSDIRFKSLNIPHWECRPDETWCILGANASGKGLLASLLTGEESPESGEIIIAPRDIRSVSFEDQQAVYEQELRNDDTDFMDRFDHGTTGLDFLLQSGCDLTKIEPFARKFRIEHILGRGYRLLSSGEARKILLLREILSEPGLLILDEPFEGLDSGSRLELHKLVEDIVTAGHPLLFMVNRLDDIPACATHLGILRQGQLIHAGPVHSLDARAEWKQLVGLDEAAVPDLPSPPPGANGSFNPLIRMRQCKVQYGDIVQFQDFNWELKAGDHALVTGPNGAGKSTLLQLISGDHPQCYSNDIEVFGYQRGSGESIWDIKKHIGIVSAALHRDYRAPGNALTTVISGLHDSIGLYQQASQMERKLAMQWLEVMGLGPLANASFRQLSYGQQRLVLIARGLIKQPPLLILDEPTQGLDDLNRHLVLAFIQNLAKLQRTTILFVSHREDEHLPLFGKNLHFEISTGGSALYEIKSKDTSISQAGIQ